MTSVRCRLGFAAAPFLCLLGVAVSAPLQTPPKVATPEDIEFFEKKVRPILSESCVSCHSGPQPSGSLNLEKPSGLFAMQGGKTLVSPGDPDKSLFIHAIRYTIPALRMPPSGKLPAEQIAVLEDWVKRGAPIPKEAGKAPVAPKVAGFPLAERRKFWSYRPVVRPAVPKVKNAAWVRNPIDAFLLARMEATGLKPAAPADKRTLLRRVTFDLTGLPPTPAEVNAFLADKSPNAYERVVERLLASPAYGERWGRHWLDLVRYGEAMGHEFDFEIPNAYQYRDYVIRAFNADVPYNLFLREQIAGDLMTKPRYNTATGVNESIMGTGFWWLGEGKHSPVDVRQEQADRIDNQIDVFGKAFLGQTIACARCHDHKFDPIPTKDYYALYGILKSSRYQQANVDAPTSLAGPVQRLDTVRASVARPALATAWQKELASVSDDKLNEIAKQSLAPAEQGEALSALAKWKPSGEAFSTLGKPGDLLLTNKGDRPVLGILSGISAHSALRSRRLEGALRSPTFTIDKDFLRLRLSGQQGRVHIIVENFQLIRDPIYGPLSFTVDNANPEWRTVDLKLWKGRRAYLELSDSPLSNLTLGDIAPQDKPFEGWVRLDAFLLTDAAKPAASRNPWEGKTAADLRGALSATLERWAQSAVTPRDAASLDLLDRLLRDGILPTPSLSETTRQIAAIEPTIPLSTRAVAMCEGDGENEVVFLRGNHKTPGETAPRLQLAAFFREKTPAPAESGSGRRELAAWITDPKHPLTTRVMVNRLWKHHFGTGIVATPDDLGHMGERPTNPALLDWLSSEFVQRDWSMKSMHRLMVLSSTYRMSSLPANPAAVKSKDPKNTMLSFMPVRRLEAEAIRDSILSASGRLDKTLYGPSVPVYLSEFSEGRGRPRPGPMDGAGRRSIYLSVRRNFPSTWLAAFDFPTPFTTIGRRTVSNVPAQALALMNGPFVKEQAQVWADRLLKETPDATVDARINALYQTAFSRLPTTVELADAREFIGDKTNDKTVWADLCHVLFNVKEFIFVR